MADALSLEGSERVLRIRAGSGHQAAALSVPAREFIATESQPVLADSASERLKRKGYRNVRVEQGDGSIGWPRAAPFDAILVTAGAPAIPPPLIDRLAERGGLAIPVGRSEHQEFLHIVKTQRRIAQASICPCQFVLLVGRYGWPRGEEAHGG